MTYQRDENSMREKVLSMRSFAAFFFFTIYFICCFEFGVEKRWATRDIQLWVDGKQIEKKLLSTYKK